MSSSRTVRRAMVLAAGLGTRLRPLTTWLPKPLVPVAGVPVVRRTLRHLAAAGVEEVVLNLHHLGERLRSALGPACEGVRIHYLEEERILGTGGGVRNALGWLGDAPFFLVNGDVVIDPDFKGLLALHERSGAAATMLLRAVPDAARWGAVEIDGDGIVRKLLGEPDGRLTATMFTGVHVIDPARVGPLLPEEGCIVRSAYRALVPRGEVAGLLHTGSFHDIGTPRSYLEANLAVAGASTFVDPTATVAPGVRLDRVVVWPNARVDADVEDAIVTP
ncbi:MAG: nucleotidyltransferase family protein [Deltaproteobacteria bacterium]|nr:nucleotidyltransferase family protein [Deltaproteobacteria bacterium]